MARSARRLFVTGMNPVTIPKDANNDTAKNAFYKHKKELYLYRFILKSPTTQRTKLCLFNSQISRKFYFLVQF